MPAPRLLLLLAGLTALIVGGPALLNAVLLALTGSRWVAELALLLALLLPVRLIYRGELPQAPLPRLAPAPPRLLLTQKGEVRRGRVQRGTATVLRARNRRGVYLWRIRGGDFEVLGDDGRRLRVCGAMALDGRGLAVSEAPDASLALPGELAVPGSLELIELKQGDEVELRGPLCREQLAAGYRDTAEVEVMRGVPGDPVEIQRI